MLHAVVVVLERASGVVGRIDKDALDLPGKLLLDGFNREQVVSKDESIVEPVVGCDTSSRVIRPASVL
jgi:hypothetical protein